MARHSVLKLQTPNDPIPAGQHRFFEHVFTGFDADLGIVDLNHADEGLQISLAERNRSGCRASRPRPARSQEAWASRSRTLAERRASCCAKHILRSLR